MAEYLIERNVPGAHELTPEQLQALSQKSCGVIRELGSEIQWVKSYVTEDKITCVYIAPNTELLFEHARRGGFPIDRVSQIRTIIDPSTAEAPVAASV